MSEEYENLTDLALSVRQPWAWAMFHAGKDVENRNWRAAFRGRVYIHASAGMTLKEYRTALDVMRLAAPTRDLPGMDELQRGGIVGVVDIVDCVTHLESPWFFGRYGLVLRNARAVPFIPLKGKLGFFKWKGLVA